MFSVQSLEMDESPFVNNDLCREVDQPNTCEVSCLHICESPGNFASETEDVEQQRNSGREGSTQCKNSAYIKETCLPDVMQTDESDKRVVLNNQAVTRKSTTKMPGPIQIECDDVQAVKQNTEKVLLNDTVLDISCESAGNFGSEMEDVENQKNSGREDCIQHTVRSPYLENVEQLCNSQQQQQHCTDSESFADDSFETENASRVSPIPENVTVETIQACDSNIEDKNNKTEVLQRRDQQRTHAVEPENTNTQHISHTNSTPCTASAIHYLPPMVLRKPFLHQHAVPMRPVNRPAPTQLFDAKIQACDRNNEDKYNKTEVLQRTHIAELDHTQHISHTDSIVDIAEPTEPTDVDDQMTAPSQPRTIRLDRVEELLEPNKLHQIRDPNNNEIVKHPQIIRLERDDDTESSSVPHWSDISDPSEPTDIEPFGDEAQVVVPREIRLNRDGDSKILECCLKRSKILFDSFPSQNKVNSSSMIIPHVVQLNDLLAKTSFGYFGVSQEDRTDEIVHFHDTPLSPAESIKSISDYEDEDNQRYDTPLLPAESVKSLSDNEDSQRYASEFPIPRALTLDDYDQYDVTDVKNKCLSSSSATVKPDQVVSNHQYLSDGEIVDDEEEDEFGIFQVQGYSHQNRTEKQDTVQQQKSGKKRPHESSVRDVGLQCYGRSEDGPDHSKSSKQQKMSSDVESSEFLMRSAVDEDCDKSPPTSTPPRRPRLLCHRSKATSKSLSLRKQKRKKHKAVRASVSSEQLLVQNSSTTKRKVVIVSKTAKTKELSGYRFLPSVTVSYGNSPHFLHGPLSDKTLESDLLEFRKRALKRKHISEWHRRHHTHKKKSRVHKHTVRQKKHKWWKKRSDAEGTSNSQRHDRARSRSFHCIEETIRSEQQQLAANIHHLQSVVVHKNNLVSARQQSASVSSHDNHHSVDDVASPDVSHNSESQSRNAFGGQLHLSRLSYSGEVEQDAHTTLLGEYIKSNCGLDYDVNCISRYLANLCSSVDDADDEVEILSVSYPGEMQTGNSSQQIAESSDGIDSECRAVTRAQRTVVPIQGWQSSATGVSATDNSLQSHRIGTNAVESKKVTLSSKEVQTETPNNMTRRGIVADNSNSKLQSNYGKSDKELQVSSTDSEGECICCPSFTVNVDSNTVTPEQASQSNAMCGIQSPEHHVEEGGRGPRPVLLERMDCSEPTPASPHHDLSNFYITVPNVSKSWLPVTQSIALERLAEGGSCSLPQVTSSNNMTVENAPEQCQLGISAVSNTAVSSVSDAGHVQGNVDSNATEQLSYKNTVSDVVSNACKKEIRSNTPGTATYVHNLSPMVSHNRFQQQCPVSLHPVNRPLTEKDKMTVTHSSTAHLPSRSAIQQLPNEPFIVSSCARTCGANTSSSATSMLSAVSLSAESGNKKCSPDVRESLSFFSLKSDRIPGICEDAEPDVSDSKIGTSSSVSHRSMLCANLYQTGNLGDVNVVATADSTSMSKSPQCNVVPNTICTSYVGTSSHVAPSQLTTACVTPNNSNFLLQQQIGQVLPLLSVLAANLFGTPVQQQTMSLPASSAASVTTSSVISAATVSSADSLVTPPAMRCATMASTSSVAAVGDWLMSLPERTQDRLSPPSPTPSEGEDERLCPPNPPLPKATMELDFDVDAVESPKSDEIMSFSPPPSEHMMAIFRMKKASTKLPTKPVNGLKKSKEMTVSLEILVIVV